MPRNLPWLLETTSTKNSPSSRDTTPPARPRSRRATASTKQNAPTPGPSSNSRPRHRDFLRSSPTPPSSPIHRCPSEEYILPSDEIYMMVEDEFYAVAQTFTQHLHYAEYVRRKKEVKALKQLQQFQKDGPLRPTDGVTVLSEEQKRVQARGALEAKQRVGLERLGGGGRPVVDSDDDTGDDVGDNLGQEEEEDETWAGTSLHELMVSPRKVRSLVGMQGIRSSTRAAAGFAVAGTGRDIGDGEYDEETASDDDDDLDAHVKLETTPTAQRRSHMLRSTSSDSKTSDTKTTTPRAENARSMNTTSTATATYRTPTPSSINAKRRLFFDDWDQLPEPPESTVQGQSRLSSSSSETPPPIPRASDPKAKKSRLNEVPTFLL
ncbi:uncharacterized protein BO97DRAFT_261904 [Aspergillus homomorphus CBS 101889]|uniref:Uncharacterized protein n=1 Tax=Aspergillus homomorphus (strain CBS 101889) TaxID=1450537 RepID=A0A395I5B4_ASPHC|nr:hypothetical protein BO97DRAFT_261904 [Aspergillus homomorphus CBS 101889]RAL14975.1 hypothetical protein BO97DRAFT_261904 [Aspergillus homomorphus CBS 101889]